MVSRFGQMHNDYLDPDKAGVNDEYPTNADFEEMFCDYISLYHLYRAVYKYTPCGPTVGVTVFMLLEQPNADFPGPNCYPDERWGDKTFYGSDLARLGEWKDMHDQGILIKSLHVSSIVEGCDEGTDTITIDWKPEEEEPEEMKDKFWQAVKDTDREADRIWNETHGCDTCRKHWKDAAGELHYDDEQVEVWEGCPDCHGLGVPI